MRHFSIILFLGLAATSCSPKITNSSTTKIKDSLVIVTKTIYDTVRIGKDSVEISWINSAIATDSTFEEVNGRADLKIVRSHGKIMANCKCDSLTIVKKFLNRDTVHNITTTIRNQTTRMVQYTSNFDKFCRWFFIVICTAAGIFTAFKLRKFFV